jgi:hypothetical protein
MASNAREAEIGLLHKYLSGIESDINAIGMVPRNFDLYPFDMMGLGLLSKAFGLAQSVFVLLDAQFDDEAFGLSRSLVECSLLLRFLTEDRDKIFERTRQYMEFAVADKEYWIYWARQSGMSDAVAADIEEYAKTWNLAEDPKTATRHWSGRRSGFAWDTMTADHPLDVPGAHETTKKVLYALEYHQTSSYVHCLSTGIDNYLPRDSESFRVVDRSRRWDILYLKVLVLILRHIHACAVYTLYGLNVDRPQSIDERYAEALKELPPHVPCETGKRHRRDRAPRWHTFGIP